MRVIAFYLPQFHPIPENDGWWGTGFTEWSRVAAARPRFRGHEQPRLPGELGFYDLRLAETRIAQARLARDHGVEAFCYYHYWFSGKRLLERPFDEVLASGEPDFPFCLCWANEPWTRAWSDREGEVLIGQSYSEADDVAHARHLVGPFSDPRYLRVEGRPLFLVYRASALPNPRRTAAILKHEAVAAGLPEPFLCRVDSDPWVERRSAPAEHGFDAAVEFAPDWLTLDAQRGRARKTRAGDEVFAYEDLVRWSLEQPEPAWEQFRCVTPGWDNSPRRERGATILEGVSPELYGRWLEALATRLAGRPGSRRIVFVNAWNEWAEGAALEPDLRRGRAFLEATRRVVAAAGFEARGFEPAAEAGGGQDELRGAPPTDGGYRIEVPLSLEAAASGSPAPAHRPAPVGGAPSLAGTARAPQAGDGFDWRTPWAHARIQLESRRLELRAERRAKLPAPSPPASLPAGAAPRRAAIARERRRVVVVAPYALYPAMNGGSIRILNLLRHAASEFEIHLALFSMTRDDASQRQALEKFCASVTFLRREEAPPAKPWTLLPRISELFAFEAARRRLRDLVETTDPAIVQLEHAEMGQFADLFPRRRIVLTELDLNFVTLARRLKLGFDQRFPIDRWLWADKLAWRRLLRYEIRCAEQAAQVQVMSETDAVTLARYLGDRRRRIRVVDNGVDTERFVPPPGDATRDLEVLFVGSFVHSPNLDAVAWIVDEIWPRIRAARPSARLAIVGSHPPPAVEALDGRDGIDLVGTVPETAPYFQRAQVLLAPIRAGSGTRLKLVEAFASGIPVVATTVAAEGLEVVDGVHLKFADSPDELARATIELLDRREERDRIAVAARRLAVERYDWKYAAERMMSAWDELLPPAAAVSVAAPRPEKRTASIAAAGVVASPEPAVSVLIPTRNGGERLGELLAAVGRQQIDAPFEVICIDSGSSERDLEIMRRHPVAIEPIDPKTFNHGLTRDLAASRAHGRVLVFLNQDAVPVDELWLHRITAPLLRPGRYAAVQGGIRELPDRQDVFFWHSCGPRFYFTSESRGWIERHGGLGFSTVNAALRREAWERLPFGWAPILEDKKWQAGAEALGWEILDLREAAVLHSHTYDLRTLVRRCASEGYGWKLLGERYGAAQMAEDLRHRDTFRRWGSGVKRRNLHTPAEWLFPWVRPLALYWGNRWAKSVSL